MNCFKMFFLFGLNTHTTQKMEVFLPALMKMESFMTQENTFGFKVIKFITLSKGRQVWLYSKICNLYNDEEISKLSNGFLKRDSLMKAAISGN